jgi:SSS family solute:Na+ symporter
MVSTQVAVALGTIGTYLLAVLAIGYRGMKVGESSVTDWMTGGRGLGVIVLTFTYAATYHSAFAFLGAAGFIYGNGIGIYVAGYLWMVLGGLILWVVGSRIWLLGKKYGYVTPSDLFDDFYDSKSLSKIVSLVLVVSTFPYIAIQMIGVGIIFDTATQGLISFEVGAAILLLVSVVYVWMGGMRSVAWTDTLQGVFMFIAIWAAAFAFLSSAYGGSVTAFWDQLVQNYTAYVTLPGPSGLYTPSYLVSWWIVLGIGLMMTPHIFLRYYAAESPRTLRWVSATGTGYLMIFYIPIVFLALGGVAAFPDLGSADAVIPTVLYEFTPVWFASLVVSGAIAAAMSTADSQLHALATLLTRDWYASYANENLDNADASQTTFAKASVPVLAILSYIVAVQDIQFIVRLANIAFEGAAQIFPLLLGAFYWERASKEGAIAGFSAGVLVTAVLKFSLISLPAAFPGFLAGFYGLITNTAVFLGVSLVTDSVSDRRIERIQGYIDYAANRRFAESGATSEPSDD